MGRILVLLTCLACGIAFAVTAQDTLPPTQGGYVHSLGLPEIYKPYAGVAIGFTGEDGTHLTSQFRVGLHHNVLNPALELLGWSVEYHAGLRDTRFDLGGRAMVSSHILGISAGVDYSLLSRDGDVVLAVSAPIRRGGVLGGGSQLQAEWIPTHHGGINLAFTMPLHQPNMGSTRPARDYAGLREEPARPLPEPDKRLLEAVARLRDAGLWVSRLSVPYLGGLYADPGASAAAAAHPLLTWLTSNGAGVHRVADAIQDYHDALTHAFSLAVGGPADSGNSAAGDAVAMQARAILLTRVLFPYNRLLGQRKKDDTTREFGSNARGVFARWLVMQSSVPSDRTEAALYVFQQLLDLVEDVRAANREAWGDSRLVWLPLQLALTPDQYDEQDKLDALIDGAVGRPLLHGNRMWYVYNDRFQENLRESIGRAQIYHLLWVHDFRGLNDAGKPDRLSLLVATQAYLNALRERVQAYDSTGNLPVYMLFLDQLYFEANKSRDLLNLLQDPLGRLAHLPVGFDSLEKTLTDAQLALRQAVDGSRLLRAERAQYGEAWLHRLVKVHVSITNPADPSFRSPQILPLLGIPDDLMRDHRKAVLYDVSEADPYRGMAMFAGMGVGEHYAGPMWEDRAIMLQGPAALALRDAARSLLEVNGLHGGEIPQVLRPVPKALDYDERVQIEIDSINRAGGAATRAIELFNGTGFGTKEISVAEATLFNLLSPGGVVKVPDSLWLNELLASLLTGAALRGVRVLMIMPSQASAPSPGWPQMAMMHDLGSRVIAVGHELAPVLDSSGGVLRVGVYDAEVGVDDLRDRVFALRRRLTDTPFLRQLYGFDSAVYRVLDSADVLLASKSPDSNGGTAVGVLGERPKLHFKGFLYICKDEWNSLVSGPTMAVGLREFLLQRAIQVNEGAAVSEDSLTAALQRVGQKWIGPILDSLTKAGKCDQTGTRCGWSSFLQVGSPNQNYRTMVMDGEGAVLVTNWTSLYAVPDFVLLTGLTVWPDSQQEFDRLMAPPSTIKQMLAWWLRMAI